MGTERTVLASLTVFLLLYALWLRRENQILRFDLQMKIWKNTVVS